MICHLIQKQLMHLEKPAEASGMIEEHLTSCPECREAQRRLVLLERNVACLPVPTTHGRIKLLRRLLSAGEPVTTRTAQREPNYPRLASEAATLKHDLEGTLQDARALGEPAPAPLARRKPMPSRAHYNAMLGVAASLILFLAGLGIWQFSQEPTETPIVKRTVHIIPDPLVASLLQRDLRLAEAETAKDRIESLVGLADDLRNETRSLLPNAEAADLQALAKMYAQVVREGVIPGAREVPADQRRRLLGDVADRFALAEQEIAKMIPAATNGVAGSLNAIASAARDGHVQLRALVREATR